MMRFTVCCILSSFRFAGSCSFRAVCSLCIFRFFRQTLSKKPHFSEKKTKKSPGPRIPRDERLHTLYSKFFGKRSEKNGLFLKKVLIPSFCRYVHTQKIAKRSTFFQKTFQAVYSYFFRKRSVIFAFFSKKSPAQRFFFPRRAILLSSIFSFFRQTIRDFCIFLEKKFCFALFRMPNDLSKPYIQKFSANDQRETDFSSKKVGNRTSLSGLSPGRGTNWPLIFEKSGIFSRRLRSPVRIPHGSRFSESLKCLSLHCFFGQMPLNSLLRKSLWQRESLSGNTQKPRNREFSELSETSDVCLHPVRSRGQRVSRS